MRLGYIVNGRRSHTWLPARTSLTRASHVHDSTNCVSRHTPNWTAHGSWGSATTHTADA